jgi:uncharacterized membrane protein
LRYISVMAAMQESAPGTVFEAVIVPYRSLSPRALRLLIGTVCALSCGTSTVFWWLGAWPVAGFTGAEILLAILLLRHNARAQRASEVVLLREDAMRVIRTDMNGRREELTLPAAWLNVALEEKPGRVPGLFLVVRGRREEVARSLGEAEKRDLAEALRAALHGWRNPRFDNPQLRGRVTPQ